LAPSSPGAGGGAAAEAGRSILSLPGAKGAGKAEAKKGSGAANKKGGEGSGAAPDRRARGRAERRARADERKYLGAPSSLPAVGEMLQLYVVLTLIILGVGSYSGLQHRRNRRNNPLAPAQQRQLQLRS
jgi:hypothetical protein